MKTFCKIIVGVLLALQLPLHSSESSNAIEQARNHDQFLYLLFYKDNGESTQQAKKIVTDTLATLGNKASGAFININDASEKAIVKTYDLKRSPMPFLLVLAPNGAITGGFAKNFTQEQLAGSITTKATAQCLKCLQDHHLVLLSVQNNMTASNQEALKGVTAFKNDPQFSPTTDIVLIDPSNPEEQTFLSQLGIKAGKEALTVMIAPPAQVIKTYTGPTSKEQITKDLQSASAGCCGPGGCCPGGCCPGGKCGP
jgi:hypothetical protein